MDYSWLHLTFTRCEHLFLLVFFATFYIILTVYCDIVKNDFRLQACYYIHFHFPFRNNTPEKGMNPLIPAAVG